MKESVKFLDVVQTLAIVFGIGFGVLELSNLRAERAQQAVLEVASSFQNPRLMTGLTTAAEIPEGASAEEVLQQYDGSHALLNETGQILETVGVLVYRGELDIRLVDDLLGGATIMFWGRTRSYWEYWRREMERPAIGEWLQWLAERLAELNSGEQPPAYEAFRDWRPSA